MSLFHAFVLGVVEGITEFLPISSTGHLILASRILDVPQTDFVKSFEIAIQLGAILSIVVLYWRDLLTKWEAMKKIAAAFVPTAIIGLAFYTIIKTYLIGNDIIVLWSLVLGGVALIAFETWHEESGSAADDISNISYKQAVAIGLCQAVAVVPGVSRSAATIVGGLLLGVKRRTIVEFSFLLAVPTMAAATGLDLLKTSASFSAGEYSALAVGFIVSFLVAIVAVKWLLRFIQTHDFKAFGWYRIIASLAFWLFVLR